MSDIKPTMCVELDPSRNRLRVGDNHVQGRGRWAALILSHLTSRSPAWLHVAEVHRQMAAAGQRTPLDRTGMTRLVDSMREMVDAALGGGSFDTRFRYQPRRLTVGEWAFVPKGDEAWTVLNGPQPSPTTAGAGRFMPNTPTPLVGLTLLADSTELFRALELTFSSDSMANHGLIKDAMEAVRAALSLDRLSPEFQVVLRLRLARHFKRSGRHDDAAAQLDLALQPHAGGHVHDGGLQVYARFMQLRNDYDGSSTKAHSEAALAAVLADATGPDPRVASEVHNLRALQLRRVAVKELAGGNKASGAELLDQAWQHISSAMYWAVSMRDHENCENYLFNMGLIQTTMHEAGSADGLANAYRCYDLGLQLRDNFSVGRDSVWDQIFIADLWLEHPELRAQVEGSLSLGRARLSEVRFFDDALTEAKAIGEPRQIALCWVNLWRFGETCCPDADKAAAICFRARRGFREFMRGQEDLLRSLRDECGSALARMGL